MRRAIRAMAALGAAGACVLTSQAVAMEGEHAMAHGAAVSGAMAPVETAGAAQGRGSINAVDVAGRSVNISHGPIPELSWPGMTMDLPVAEQVDLGGLKPGDRVDFGIVLGTDNVYRIVTIKRSD